MVRDFSWPPLEWPRVARPARDCWRARDGWLRGGMLMSRLEAMWQQRATRRRGVASMMMRQPCSTRQGTAAPGGEIWIRALMPVGAPGSPR